MLLFVAIGLGALLLRSLHYPSRVNFSTDQGVFGLRAHELWTHREITLVGPRTSFEYQGKVIFQSSLIFYVYLFFLLVGGFEPIASSYAFTLFSVGMLVPLGIGLYFLKNEKAAMIGCSLYAFLPFFVNFTTFLWNPNFQLAFLPLLILMLGILHKTGRRAAYVGVGVVLGFLLLFHYQAVLFFLLVLIYLLARHRPPLKGYGLVLLGAMLGFSPMILSEFRSHFYMLQTIWTFAHHLPELTTTSGGGFAQYYFMGSIFLLLMALSILLASKISNKLLTAGVGLLFVASLRLYLPTPSNAFGMIKNWNYRNERAVFEIIKNEGLENFAVASPTYDTTASVQYYLLRVNNVDGFTRNYQTNDYLFIINTTADFKTNPAYEIHTFSPHSLIKTWKINSDYQLYLLKRE